MYYGTLILMLDNFSEHVKMTIFSTMGYVKGRNKNRKANKHWLLERRMRFCEIKQDILNDLKKFQVSPLLRLNNADPCPQGGRRYK